MTDEERRNGRRRAGVRGRSVVMVWDYGSTGASRVVVVVVAVEGLLVRYTSSSSKLGSMLVNSRKALLVVQKIA
ncbi:unnamed protein product [Calypogeia fissa]